MERTDETGPGAVVELAPELALARGGRRRGRGGVLCDRRILGRPSRRRAAGGRRDVQRAGRRRDRANPVAPRSDRRPRRSGDAPAERRDDRGWRVDEFAIVRLLTDVTADQATFEDRDGCLSMGPALLCTGLTRWRRCRTGSGSRSGCPDHGRCRSRSPTRVVKPVKRRGRSNEGGGPRWCRRPTSGRVLRPPPDRRSASPPRIRSAPRPRKPMSHHSGDATSSRTWWMVRMW